MATPTPEKETKDTIPVLAEADERYVQWFDLPSKPRQHPILGRTRPVGKIRYDHPNENYRGKFLIIPIDSGDKRTYIVDDEKRPETTRPCEGRLAGHSSVYVGGS